MKEVRIVILGILTIVLFSLAHFLFFHSAYISVSNKSESRLESIVIYGNYDDTLFFAKQFPINDSIEAEIDLPGEIAPKVEVVLTNNDTIVHYPYLEAGYTYIFIFYKDTVVSHYGSNRYF